MCGKKSVRSFSSYGAYAGDFFTKVRIRLGVDGVVYNISVYVYSAQRLVMIFLVWAVILYRIYM